MSKEIVRKKAQDVISTLGRSALHAIAPDDFELYACSLELVNSYGEIEEIFHFPVMPNGIQIGRQSLASIKKTGQGYLSQFSNTFVGKNININGTFGRKFRLLVGDLSNRSLSAAEKQQFDLKIKTGYGAFKLLEKMVEKSFELDEKYNQPRLLIFHNFAINHHHIVEVINFSPTQSMENNMLWNYTLEMKALAEASSLSYNGNKKGHLVNLLAVSALQKSANIVFDNISLQGLERTGAELNLF